MFYRKTGYKSYADPLNLQIYGDNVSEINMGMNYLDCINQIIISPLPLLTLK